MKSIQWLAVLALLIVLPTGCARYKVTFENQTVTTSRGKPKYDKAEGTFAFKDASGKKRVVPAGTVKSIEPY